MDEASMGTRSSRNRRHSDGNVQVASKVTVTAAAHPCRWPAPQARAQTLLPRLCASCTNKVVLQYVQAAGLCRGSSDHPVCEVEVQAALPCMLA